MSIADLDRRVHLAVAAALATGFFVLMALALIATPGLDQDPRGGAEDFGSIADTIFDTHVLALEALGILLTAALIGAMVIARPLGSTPDDVHYASRRDAEGLAEVQYISDVDRNLGAAGFTSTSVPATHLDTEEEE